MVKLVLLQSQVTGMDVHVLVELGNGVLVVEVDVGEGKAEEELESWVEVVTQTINPFNTRGSCSGFSLDQTLLLIMSAI